MTGNNNNPHVGVVIPAYNASRYVSKCLESVLAQQGVSLRVVVVDDGSKDDTAEIVRTLALRDGRVTLHTQANAGACTARNKGAELLARSDDPPALVCFLDADDVVLPGAFPHLAGILADRADAVAAHGLAEMIDGSDTIHSGFPAFMLRRLRFDGQRIEKMQTSSDTDFNVLLVQPVYPPACFLYRMKTVQAIGGWDAPLSPYEQELRAQAQPMGDRVAFVPFRDRAAVAMEYAQASIHCVPSVWNEPFGLTTLEGMASALPVVASRVGGIPEVVGPEGLLFDPQHPDQLTDHLAALLRDADDARRVGDTMRRRAEQFAWPIQYEKLAALINAPAAA